MKAITLYRIAAIILLLFTVGHTFGFLTFRPHSPEGVAVLDAMNGVHFQEHGNNFSYGNFYRGFGLSISVSMLFSAYLSWRLGWMARNSPAAIGMVGWFFGAVQVGGIIIGWVYFSLVQAAFAAVVAICVLWAAAAVPAAPCG